MTQYGILKKHIYNSALENRASSFCKCPELKRQQNADHSNALQCQLTCECGEDASNDLEWSWDNRNTVPRTHINGNFVIFHPFYSQGTSIIRGDKVLKRNMHHYWEIKIISSLSGTDIMLGIGTDDVNLQSHRFRFASVLGLDEHSWGYSYRGLVQHRGVLKYYGKKFSQGCIIGVHLDLFHGTLEFYLNRRPLGKAFRNIPLDDAINIYPMACSTSARSSIKLINSASFSDTLQFNCMRVLSKDPKLLSEMNELPGLKKLAEQYWFLKSPEQYQYGEFEHNNLLLEDEAIICGLKKSKKLEFYECVEKSADDDDKDSSNGSLDPYEGMHITKQAKIDYSHSSDEESVAQNYFPYFCDH